MFLRLPGEIRAGVGAVARGAGKRGLSVSRP